MLRSATRMIVGTAMALALAGGWGASAASSASHGDPHRGAVDGRANVVPSPGNSGVVDVFNASGRLVAHHDVRPGDNHFRFVLKPGGYELQLKMTPPNKIQTGCPSRYWKKAVRIRTNHTSHLTLSQLCSPGGY